MNINIIGEWYMGNQPLTFTGSVWNVRNNVNIYVCQQHGGLLGGIRYRCSISVNFVFLFLFSSAKNLPAIRSFFESYFQSFKSLQEFPWAFKLYGYVNKSKDVLFVQKSFGRTRKLTKALLTPPPIQKRTWT